MRGGVQEYQLTGKGGALYHEPPKWFKNRSDCSCYGPEKDQATKDSFGAYIDHDGTTVFSFYKLDGTVDMKKRWCTLNTDDTFEFSPEPEVPKPEEEEAPVPSNESPD